MTLELPVFTIDELAQVRFEFDAFTNDDAVNLGLAAVEVITERGLDLAVDVRRGDDLVFRAKIGGTTGPANDPWLAGKAAVSRKHGVPSLLVRLQFEQAGTPYPDEMVDGVTLRAHGGSIPILIGGEVVGTMTVSGQPDVVDHDVCAEALSRFADT